MLTANVEGELHRLWVTWADYRDTMTSGRRHFSYEEQQDALGKFFEVRSQVLLHLEHRDEKSAVETIRKYIKELETKEAAVHTCG